MPLGSHKAALMGAATGGGGTERAVFGGGSDPSTDAMEYVTISSTSDVTDFGDLSANWSNGGSASNGSTDRGLWYAGSWTGIDNDTIEYITISTTGDSTNFGNAIIVNAVHYSQKSTSNGTDDRAVSAGGWCNPCSPVNGQQNSIDYVTVSSAGDATDFGNLVTRAKGFAMKSNGTSERGIKYRGSNGQPNCHAAQNSIEYITINSASDATDFGDSGLKGEGLCGVDNGTNDRMCAIGNLSPCDNNVSNVIEYITISSTGDATDFGDTTSAGHGSPGATSSGTSERGIWGGGSWGSPIAVRDQIEYITINSTGNSTDFGDLSAVKAALGAVANAD